MMTKTTIKPIDKSTGPKFSDLTIGDKFYFCEVLYVKVPYSDSYEGSDVGDRFNSVSILTGSPFYVDSIASVIPVNLTITSEPVK